MNEHIEIKGTEIVKTYTGDNDYILQLKYRVNKKLVKILTYDQATYVIKNQNVKPLVVNKKVILHYSVREFFKTRFRLDFVPTYLFINKLLSRSNDEIDLWASFDESRKEYKFITTRKNNLLPEEPEDIDLDLTKLKRQPMPHQIEAIQKLLKNNRFILADDMGLGKTASAISAAVLNDSKKILIICPASLKTNWKKEILQVVDCEDDISIIGGNNMTIKKWNIINYDIIKNYHQVQRKSKNKEIVPSALQFYNFDLVILDEAHYIKNSQSDRSKLIIDFISDIKKVWFLTGTPITNRPMDIYNLLKACDSPVANNWEWFAYRYCEGKSFKKKGTTKKIWIVNGASNLLELKKYTENILMKRSKHEVLDLPKKTVTQRYYDLVEKSLYKMYIDEYSQWYEEECEKGKKPSHINSIAQLTKLRKLIALDKVKYTIEEIETLIEDGHNVVVFSCFTDSLKEIYNHFGKKAVLIDGSVSASKRQAIVDEFQTNPKVNVFCGNIVAAGVGLTLTKGDYVVFNDIDWTPANHSQAEDRIYRIGQDKECTIIYNLLENTIDSDIYDKLIMKFSNINTFFGEDFIYHDNSELIGSIIERMVGKSK
jgi:SWI/SNF-related matrix-associated actin-dependent regulator 1 of chromatin subfamily A